MPFYCTSLKNRLLLKKAVLNDICIMTFSSSDRVGIQQFNSCKEKRWGQEMEELLALLSQKHLRISLTVVSHEKKKIVSAASLHFSLGISQFIHSIHSCLPFKFYQQQMQVTCNLKIQQKRNDTSEACHSFCSSLLPMFLFIYSSKRMPDSHFNPKWMRYFSTIDYGFFDAQFCYF